MNTKIWETYWRILNQNTFTSDTVFIGSTWCSFKSWVRGVTFSAIFVFTVDYLTNATIGVRWNLNKT